MEIQGSKGLGREGIIQGSMEIWNDGEILRRMRLVGVWRVIFAEKIRAPARSPTRTALPARVRYFSDF